MCGLLGYICNSKKHNFGPVTLDKRKFIEQGLYISALRGYDGAGIGVVRKPNEGAFVYKRALAPADFLQLKMTERILNNLDDAQAVLAHSRSATRGFVGDYSSHPFKYDHITLIHNGTIFNSQRWAKGSNSDVDSAHIAYGISTDGAKEVLEEVNGDYCIVWHDSKEGTVNIAKNSGRPLHWAQVPEWDAYVFMSEMTALAHVLARNNIKIKDKFYFPKNNTIYSFQLGQDKLEYTETPFEPGTTRSRGSPHTGPRTGSRDTNGRWKTQTPEGGNSGKTDTTSTTIEETLLARIMARGKPKKRPGDAGRPKSRKAIVKATSRLRGYGLNFDSQYAASAKVFFQYENNPKMGFVVMTMNGMENKDKQAEIHGVTDQGFRAMREVDWIFARAVNVKNYGKERVVILELDDADVDYELEQEIRGEEALPKDVVDNIVPVIMGPNSRMVTRARWDELTKDGCCNCSGNCNPMFARNIIWLGETHDQPLCHVCGADQKVLNDLALFGGGTIQ